jgi:hypothetical protein
MTQVVESLLCKCKAPSSNPSLTKKEENKSIIQLDLSMYGTYLKYLSSRKLLKLLNKQVKYSYASLKLQGSMEGSQDKNGMKVEIQIRKTVLHWFSP